MKKWIKHIRTVTICLIPIGLVIAFSNNWSNKQPISCVGSSGVKPFMEELSKDYMQSNKKVDITVEAGGSGFGIQQIAEGFANIGNASKDPYGAIYGKDEKGTDGFRNEWETKKIKTITIGWEAICMIYIPPKGINLSFEELNKLLVVNNKNDNGNIYELMRVFSGINDQKHKIDNPTLFDFYNTNIFLDDSRQQLLKTTSIKPYVRAGGSLTSGTASSFFSNTNLGFDRSKLTSEQQKAFDVGNYGTAYDLEQTDEANSRAWDMFAKNNNPGQIVYLSSGFVQKNQDLIKAKGYGIMSYGDNATHFTTDSIDTKDGYNWFRPINTMIVTPKDGSSAEVEFLKTILSESYKDKLEKIGAKHLNDDEMEWMFPNGITLAWMSDIELAIHYANSWNWPENGYFAPKPTGIA